MDNTIPETKTMAEIVEEIKLFDGLISVLDYDIPDQARERSHIAKKADKIATKIIKAVPPNEEGVNMLIDFQNALPSLYHRPIKTQMVEKTLPEMLKNMSKTTEGMNTLVRMWYKFDLWSDERKSIEMAMERTYPEAMHAIVDNVKTLESLLHIVSSDCYKEMKTGKSNSIKAKLREALPEILENTPTTTEGMNTLIRIWHIFDINTDERESIKERIISIWMESDLRNQI